MYQFYILAAIAGLMGATGDILLNQGLKFGGLAKIWWIVAGFIAWNISVVAFMLVVRSNLLTQTVIVFLITNSILVLVVGQLAFHEALTKSQWFWIFVGILAMVGMELGKRH